ELPMNSRPSAILPAREAPFRAISFAPEDIACERAADGVVRMRSRVPLGRYVPSLAAMFRAAVDAQPGRLFLAERDGDAWCGVTYEEARPRVDALAQTL